jgi:hypothetical protein
MRPQRQILKNEPNVPLMGLDIDILFFRKQNAFSQLNCSRLRRQQTGNDVKQRGLSGSTGSPQHGPFTG